MGRLPTGIHEGGGYYSRDHKASDERDEREFITDKLLVRIHLIIEMNLADRPCAMMRGDVPRRVREHPPEGAREADFFQESAPRHHDLACWVKGVGFRV